jgi:uncharacterized short protein YbdD (DUF466 family)
LDGEFLVTTRELLRTARVRMANAGAVVRRIIGAPDYDRYLAHLHDRHPGAKPMTYDEFAMRRMTDRYSRPGTRCC